MASITSVHLLRRRLTFRDDSTGSERYEAVYEVLTSALITDARRIKNDPRLPQVGSPYSFDSDAVCVSVEGEIDEKAGTLWQVHAEFSNDPGELAELNLQKRPHQNSVERNPLDRVPKISWRTARGKKIATFGLRRGLATPRTWSTRSVPVQNAAGQPYNPPPMVDDSMWVGSFNRNYTRVPQNILTYKDAVNLDVFLFDGVTIYPRWAKLGAITVSPWQRANGIPFRNLALDLEFKPKFLVSFGGQTLNQPQPGGWDLVLLNRGFLVRDEADGNLIRATDNDGNPTPEPVFLDTDGVQTTPSNSVDEEYRVYLERPFQPLLFGGK